MTLNRNYSWSAGRLSCLTSGEHWRAVSGGSCAQCAILAGRDSHPRVFCHPRVHQSPRCHPSSVKQSLGGQIVPQCPNNYFQSVKLSEKKNLWRRQSWQDSSNLPKLHLSAKRWFGLKFLQHWKQRQYVGVGFMSASIGHKASEMSSGGGAGLWGEGLWWGGWWVTARWCWGFLSCWSWSSTWSTATRRVRSCPGPMLFEVRFWLWWDGIIEKSVWVCGFHVLENTSNLKGGFLTFLEFVRKGQKEGCWVS